MIHRNMMVSRCETWWHDGEWVGTVGTRWVKHENHEACTSCSSLVTSLLVFMKFSNRQATLVSFKEFVPSFWSAAGILPCFFVPLHIVLRSRIYRELLPVTPEIIERQDTQLVRQKVIRKKWFEIAWWIWFVTMVWEALSGKTSELSQLDFLH